MARVSIALLFIVLSIIGQVFSLVVKDEDAVVVSSSNKDYIASSILDIFRYGSEVTNNFVRRLQTTKAPPKRAVQRKTKPGAKQTKAKAKVAPPKKTKTPPKGAKKTAPLKRASQGGSSSEGAGGGAAGSNSEPGGSGAEAGTSEASTSEGSTAEGSTAEGSTAEGSDSGSSSEGGPSPKKIAPKTKGKTKATKSASKVKGGSTKPASKVKAGTKPGSKVKAGAKPTKVKAGAKPTKVKAGAKKVKGGVKKGRPGSGGSSEGGSSEGGTSEGGTSEVEPSTESTPAPSNEGDTSAPVPPRKKTAPKTKGKTPVNKKTKAAPTKKGKTAPTKKGKAAPTKKGKMAPNKTPKAGPTKPGSKIKGKVKPTKGGTKSCPKGQVFVAQGNPIPGRGGARASRAPPGGSCVASSLIKPVAKGKVAPTKNGKNAPTKKGKAVPTKKGKAVPTRKGKVVPKGKTPTKCVQLTNAQATCYIARYSDLQRAFGNNLNAARKHWCSKGRFENRTFACPSPKSGSPKGKGAPTRKGGKVAPTNRAKTPSQSGGPKGKGAPTKRGGPKGKGAPTKRGVKGKGAPTNRAKTPSRRGNTPSRRVKTPTKRGGIKGKGAPTNRAKTPSRRGNTPSRRVKTPSRSGGPSRRVKTPSRSGGPKGKGAPTRRGNRCPNGSRLGVCPDGQSFFCGGWFVPGILGRAPPGGGCFTSSRNVRPSASPTIFVAPVSQTRYNYVEVRTFSNPNCVGDTINGMISGTVQGACQTFGGTSQAQTCDASTITINTWRIGNNASPSCSGTPLNTYPVRAGCLQTSALSSTLQTCVSTTTPFNNYGQGLLVSYSADQAQCNSTNLLVSNSWTFTPASQCVTGLVNQPPYMIISCSSSSRSYVMQQFPQGGNSCTGPSNTTIVPFQGCTLQPSGMWSGVACVNA